METPRALPKGVRMVLPGFDAALAVLLVTVLVAGLAKGLSGFGTGMIVAPVAGALYGPKAALVVVVLIDSLPSVPITVPVLPLVRWREVLPVTTGLLLFFPAGIYILTHGDTATLRWTISIAVLACAATLMSGYRYRGPRNAAVSLGVGGVAGVLSGIASIPGPPVIAYWMASGLPVAIVRANLLTLFLLGEVISLGNIWVAGLLQSEVVAIALVAAPVYFAGLLAGARGFDRSGERTYRIVTYALIVLAAVLALPLFDGLLPR